MIFRSQSYAKLDPKILIIGHTGWLCLYFMLYWYLVWLVINNLLTAAMEFSLKVLCAPIFYRTLYWSQIRYYALPFDLCWLPGGKGKSCNRGAWCPLVCWSFPTRAYRNPNNVLNNWEFNMASSDRSDVSESGPSWLQLPAQSLSVGINEIYCSWDSLWWLPTLNHDGWPASGVLAVDSSVNMPGLTAGLKLRGWLLMSSLVKRSLVYYIRPRSYVLLYIFCRLFLARVVVVEPTTASSAFWANRLIHYCRLHVCSSWVRRYWQCTKLNKDEELSRTSKEVGAEGTHSRNRLLYSSWQRHSLFIACRICANRYR